MSGYPDHLHPAGTSSVTAGGLPRLTSQPRKEDSSPVGSRHGTNESGTSVSSGGGDGDKGFLPVRGPAASGPSAPSAAIVMPSFLPKRSLQYIFYAGTMVIGIARLAFYDFYVIGVEHEAELKSNVKPAWVPFRWLGSHGVDVADLQWYYFVVALPPFLPFLLLFVALSKRAKQHSAPIVMAYSPAAAAVMESHRRHQLAHSPGGYAEEGGEGDASEDAPELDGLPPRPTTNHSPDASLAVTTSVNVAAGHVAGADHGKDGNHRYLYFGRNLTQVYVIHIVFGVLMAAMITSTGFIFGIALVLFNYFVIAQLLRFFSFRVSMAIMWTVHVAFLFINFHADGYRFAWFGLSFLDDLYPTLIRWNVHYNMTVLRMIAYNNDYWQACLNGEEAREKAWRKHDRSCADCAVIRDSNRHISPTGGQSESLRCYKCRTECPRPEEEYNLLSYLAYMFYPPLFMAGPMSSFNGYVSHLHQPSRSHSDKAVRQYGVRFVLNALGLATMMHYVWIMALLTTPATSADAVSSSAGSGTSSLAKTKTGSAASTAALSVFQQLDYVSKAKLLYMTLAFMWFKFNVIWKLFRFISLLDGVDPPEDMRRCFSNTVSIQGFWRDWHASFNLWIVRYMYIPMGGRQWAKYSVFPIFFFIAIWHDIEMRLLFWALFMSVFMVPEIAITTFFASKKNPLVLKIKRNVSLYRFLRVVATCFNMMLLIVVNLIGFSIGMSGAGSEITNVLSKMSLHFVLATVALFFCAANVAIQSRDQEAYEQHVLKLRFDLQSQ